MIEIKTLEALRGPQEARLIGEKARGVSTA
jgi:hypothetical protein